MNRSRRLTPRCFWILLTFLRVVGWRSLKKVCPLCRLNFDMIFPSLAHNWLSVEFHSSFCSFVLPFSSMPGNLLWKTLHKFCFQQIWRHFRVLLGWTRLLGDWVCTGCLSRVKIDLNNLCVCGLGFDDEKILWTSFNFFKEQLQS